MAEKLGVTESFDVIEQKRSMAGCIYIQEHLMLRMLLVIFRMKVKVRCCPWAKLSQRRLPRGFSTLVLGVLYHPPSAN